MKYYRYIGKTTEYGNRFNLIEIKERRGDREKVEFFSEKEMELLKNDIKMLSDLSNFEESKICGNCKWRSEYDYHNSKFKCRRHAPNKSQEGFTTVDLSDYCGEWESEDAKKD